MSYFVHPSAQ